jgi:hypothetical protein
MAKGLFTPLNPGKYLGDVGKIRFLSSWELRFQSFCDTNPNIIAWSSETIYVPYYHPIKKKQCHYIPDFLIKYKDSKGNVFIEIIEIKPAKEAGLTKTKNAYDLAMITVNRAKWAAAEAFCVKRNIKFRVITELDMFRTEKR